MLPGEEPWPKPTTVSVWSTFVTTPGAASTLFHFEIKDGVVVGIEEQYRP
jgi:hypothetical protein